MAWQDLAGLRPLHLLCSSKAPTEFTVKICEKLLEGQGAVVASLVCLCISRPATLNPQPSTPNTELSTLNPHSLT